MNVLGLDIGGANIKAADQDGRVRCLPFPMWQRHEALTDCLVDFVGSFEPQLVGLTMTAELADCFETKAAGVTHVVRSVCRAFPEAIVRVWLTSGEFAEPEDAVDLPRLVAAANWHALATWAARAIPQGPAILIDCGSTTTDIIPLFNGLPVPEGLNDLERLRSGELVYTGVRRTPLCAVCGAISIDDTPVTPAAEWFATTQDIHVVLGNLPQDATCTATADRRPLTRDACLSRIARMVCSDRSELSEAVLVQLAEQFRAAQSRQITDALQRVVARLRELEASDASTLPSLILSGSGVFLAAAAAESLTFGPRIDLSAEESGSVAEAACAFALARLVHERCRDDLLESAADSGNTADPDPRRASPSRPLSRPTSPSSEG